MIGIVYGSTFDRAKNELEKIKEQYEIMGIAADYRRGKIIKSTNTYKYVFENKDIWMAVKASESSRGLSCNVAYIDGKIQEELVHNIIKPTIKRRPYQAIHYF